MNSQIALALAQSNAKVWFDDTHALESDGIQIRKRVRYRTAGKVKLVDRFFPRVAAPLQVVFNESTPAPALLSRLSQVAVIMIHDGCVLRASHVASLGECTELGSLHISNQTVVDGDAWSPVLQLPNLKVLVIRQCVFKSQLLSSMDLPRLEVLGLTTLSGTLESEALSSIVNACPNLRHLDLGPVDVGGEGLARVLQLPQLEELYLSMRTDNGRLDGWLDAVRVTSPVRKLHLNGVPMRDEDLTGIVDKFPALEHIGFSIQGGSVSARGLDALQRLPGLKGVAIGDTSVPNVGILFDTPFPENWVEAIVRWQEQVKSK